MDKIQKPKYKEEGLSKEVDIEDVLDKVKRGTFGIIKQIKENIENKEYGVVLGIDSSGRVPALLIAEIIKEVAPVDVRFVVGKRTSNTDGSQVQQIRSDLKDSFKSAAFIKVKNMGKKVLIVEDSIVTGESIRLICNVLTNEGIKYDIVTLASRLEDQFQENIPPEVKGKTVSGSLGISYLYGKSQMSGVFKTGDTIFAHPLAKDAEIVEYGDGLLNQKQVLAYTRKRIKELADEIAIAAGITS